MYTPLIGKENIILTSGRADTVVVAGWLRYEDMLKLVDLYGDHFCAIGNLYSQTPGVSILLRNLLYNPQIKRVVVLSTTKQCRVSRSSYAVECFCFNGVNPFTHCVIGDGINCRIDKEIPNNQIQKLRGKLEFTFVSNLSEIKYFLPIGEVYTTSEPRLEFPMSETVETTAIQPKTGHSFKAKTVYEGWQRVVDYAIRFGKTVSTRFGGSTRECLSVMVTVAGDDLEFPPDVPQSSEQVSEYIDSFMSTDRNETASYTYASRMRHYFGIDQVEAVVETLKAQPGARGAVIDLWDSSADIDSKEPPCLNHLWFRISEGKLYVTAVFRSHDLFSAWYSNVCAIRHLQNHIASKVSADLLVGDCSIVSESAHIYDHNYTEAEIISDRFNPRETYDDSIGNFVIEINDKSRKIEVTWFSPIGDKISVITGRKALTLGREIYNNAPHIEATHLMYLGVELGRAERCLLKKQKYVQDDHITE